MFKRLTRRGRGRAPFSAGGLVSATASSAAVPSEAEAAERRAKELADEWAALDEATKEDMIAAAKELQEVHDEYKIEFVRRCYRGEQPDAGGGWRTADELRAEAAMIRSAFVGRDPQPLEPIEPSRIDRT